MELERFCTSLLKLDEASARNLGLTRKDFSDAEQYELAVKAILNFINVWKSDTGSVTDKLTALGFFMTYIFLYYRLSRGLFMHPRLYVDLMDTCCGVFFLVFLWSTEFRDIPFFFFLLGDDRVERLFGDIRALLGTGSFLNPNHCSIANPNLKLNRNPIR